MLNPRSIPEEDPRSPLPERDGESIIQLLRRLTDELLMLFRQEMALATAEVTGTLTKLAKGVASIATGALILYAGFLALLAAAILGLSNAVSPWLAVLIVGVVVSVIGAILVYAGKKTLEPDRLKPRRSIESLREDKAVLMRRES